MRVTGQSSGRFLGYVRVQVGSHVFTLPVEARPLKLEDGSALQAGFFSEGRDTFGIRVDADASESVVRETIERASAEAAAHLSRKILN